MAARKYNFIRGSDGCGTALEQGATFQHKIIWQKENPVGSDIFLPIDLTGYTAKMQVRAKISDPLILELSTANSRITLGGANGEIILNVPATVTDTLVAGKYVYDLELTGPAPDSIVTRLIEGQFEIVGQITQ